MLDFYRLILFAYNRYDTVCPSSQAEENSTMFQRMDLQMER
jgi:hypothetical protein